MENQRDLFRQYKEEKLNEKAVPEFDLIRFMDSYKRSINFYNSYGLDKKPVNPGKVLTDKNQ